MGQGFTVKADALSAGGHQVAGLVSAVESTASDVVQAITGMAGSASGHMGLASALMSAAECHTKTFRGLGTLYQHLGGSLAAAADNYDGADQTCLAHVSTIGGCR